jgi:hypothetical protein
MHLPLNPIIFGVLCLQSRHSTTWTTPPIHFFLIWLFWRWGIWNICPGWPQTLCLPISAFQVARITGVSHQHLAHYTHLVGWDARLANFLLVLASNIDQENQVARITGVCLYTHSHKSLFLSCGVCSLFQQDSICKWFSHSSFFSFLVVF